MLKKILPFLAFFLLSLSYLQFAPLVFATDTPYKITDPILSTPTDYNNRTFFETDLEIEYQTGEIMLSADAYADRIPDVKDSIEITVIRPDGTQVNYNHTFNLDCMITTFVAIPPPPGGGDTPFDPIDLTFLFTQGTNQVHVKLYQECNPTTSSTSMYLVNINVPDTGPQPFLRLPWDYQSQGLSFEDASLSINSYFDHSYPLLSTALSEPSEWNQQVTAFEKIVGKIYYSSHDGYDYGKQAGVHNGDPVLASADGCAYYHYHNLSGNSIRITHNNGYQTRYLHMQANGLITTETDPSKCISVIQGQQIGKVGFSGRVIPSGERGAHIHFMIIQDKNNDGNFNDNIPDGLVDPFGWQSSDPDPWPNYTFDYHGQPRTGAQSYYLWTTATAKTNNNIGTSGGEIQLGRYDLDFPANTTDETVNIVVSAVPVDSDSFTLRTIGSGIKVLATNLLGEIVTVFKNVFTLTIDFSNFDITSYNPGSIAIYSSSNGLDWTKEPTHIDLENKIATGQINHLSYFVLMAERKDVLPPITTARYEGQEGETGNFRSSVQVVFSSKDNDDGLGVDYTVYKLDDQDWQAYSSPFIVAEPGVHTIDFYSVDLDGNIEETKTATFTIDLIPPEAQIQFNPQTLKTEILGTDNSGITQVTYKNLYGKRKLITITDLAGNTLRLKAKYLSPHRKTFISINSYSYNGETFKSFPYNILYVKYSAQNNNLKKLFQYSWNQAQQQLYKLTYKQNQTIFVIKQANQNLHKTIQSGLILVQLSTDQGKLKIKTF